MRYKHSLSFVFTKFILSFFPKPNLWIFLNPSIKTINLRKNELSNKELNRQITQYTQFFKPKKNVLMLNTNMKKKKIISKILKRTKNLIK